MNENRKKAPTIELGAASFESEVLGSKLPVMVEFWAPWSRPCQILSSVLDEVAAACVGKVRIVKVNADDNPDLSLSYDIESIPTLLYFVNGGLRAKLVGTASKEAILAKLQAVIQAGDRFSSTPQADKKP